MDPTHAQSDSRPNEVRGARPLVSVVILTYNHAGYIDECLRSVYSQVTDFEFEVLIGDDCSTDQTQEKLKAWRDRYPAQTRLFLRDRNLGGGGCPNLEATFPECRGEFVALLEGDDYWTFEGKLQAQASVLRKFPDVSACTHSTQILSPDCAEITLFRHPQPSGDVSLEHLLTVGPPHTSSYMVRRSVLDGRAAALRTLPMGDWPLMVHCASVGRVISMPDSIWSVYRVQGQGSWSAKGLVHRTRGEIRALGAFAEVLPDRHQHVVRRQLLLRQLWLTEGLLRSDQRLAAIRESIPAYLSWPRHTPATLRQMLKLLCQLALPEVLFARRPLGRPPGN
jgi:hypothetical protein